MLTVEEALAEVIKEARPLPPAERSLLDSRGCLLAENVAADADQPPFDKSLVDGYAVRISDLTSANRRLKIGETILAGQTPTRRLGPYEAAVIMTGAPLSPEADAVVMREHTRFVHEDVVVDARNEGLPTPERQEAKTNDRGIDFEIHHGAGLAIE